MSLKNALSFFEDAHQNFLASLSKTREIKKFYRLANFTICLKFSGDLLVRFLTDALQHLEIKTAEPIDLEICIWDGVSSPLKLPWTDSSLSIIHGNVIGYDHEEVHTVFSSYLKVLQSFNKEKNLALYWVEDRKKLPWWVGASPFQFIVHWWMQTRRVQLTHAAAVGYPEGGVLLAGKGGSGKSTTSLLCMKAGMKYVSEDYCLLTDLPDVQVHTIYNSAKVTSETIAFFPEIGRHIANPDRPVGDKGLLFHHQFQPQNILPSFPLKALLSLKVVDIEKSRLELVSPKDVLAPLSGATIWQLPRSGPSVFRHLKRVAEAVPCYELFLGRDFERIPKLIKTIL